MEIPSDVFPPPSSNIKNSIAADPAPAGTIPRRLGLWRDKTGLSIQHLTSRIAATLQIN